MVIFFLATQGGWTEWWLVDDGLADQFNQAFPNKTMLTMRMANYLGRHLEWFKLINIYSHEYLEKRLVSKVARWNSVTMVSKYIWVEKENVKLKVRKECARPRRRTKVSWFFNYQASSRSLSFLGIITPCLETTRALVFSLEIRYVTLPSRGHLSSYNKVT